MGLRGSLGSGTSVLKQTQAEGDSRSPQLSSPPSSPPPLEGNILLYLGVDLTTQKVQNCPLSGPNNPVQFSFPCRGEHRGTDRSVELKSQELPFGLARPMSCDFVHCARILVALKGPVCPTVAGLPCFSGVWGHREILAHNFGLSKHNRHFRKPGMFSPCFDRLAMYTFYKASSIDKGAGFLLPKKTDFHITFYPLSHFELYYNLFSYIPS